MGPLLLKTDYYRNIEWNQTYEGQYSDAAYSLIETSDGGYALISSDTQLIKFDTYGNMEWNSTLLGCYWAYSLIQTIDGGFAWLGCNSFNPDFLLVKTDSSGDLEWSKKYEKPDMDYWQQIIQNTDGGYTLAGTLWNRSGTGHGGSSKPIQTVTCYGWRIIRAFLRWKWHLLVTAATFYAQI